MNIENAISEPLRRFVEFHNKFNRNIKITSGSLTKIGSDFIDGRGIYELTTGEEPWAPLSLGKNIGHDEINEAHQFIAELGIVRAASAFEDFETGIQAELDRANGIGITNGNTDENFEEGDGDTSTKIDRITSRLGIHSDDIADKINIIKFFKIARNCIVHRSNRANSQLTEMAQSENFRGALERWPTRGRNGEWPLSVPDVEQGLDVKWLPRHAILASAMYYDIGVTLDRALVRLLGNSGLVYMVAHWCFLAESIVYCHASTSPEIMVKHQMMARYRVQDVTDEEVISSLEQIDKWQHICTAFSRQNTSS